MPMAFIVSTVMARLERCSRQRGNVQRLCGQVGALAPVKRGKAATRAGLVEHSRAERCRPANSR